jgi:hypothetical protein
MMNLRAELERLLSDELLFAEVRRLLEEAEWAIEIEDDGPLVPIPRSAPLEVVDRSVQTYTVEMGFGDHFHACVAIGGILSVEHGIVTPGICFAALRYNSTLGFITVDFSDRLL